MTTVLPQPNVTGLDELPVLLTVNDVAKVCRVHDRSVRRWVAEARLRVVRAGGRLRIARAELLRFLSGGAA